MTAKVLYKVLGAKFEEGRNVYQGSIFNISKNTFELKTVFANKDILIKFRIENEKIEVCEIENAYRIFSINVFGEIYKNVLCFEEVNKKMLDKLGCKMRVSMEKTEKRLKVCLSLVKKELEETDGVITYIPLLDASVSRLRKDIHLMKFLFS